METNKPIKDFYGKILGYIWTDSKTKNQKATDFYGRILTRGNTVLGLLYKK